MTHADHDTGSFSVKVEDEAAFSMDRICRLRHDFDRHPLMQLDRLEQLALALMPSGQCKFIKPGAAVDSKFALASKPLDGRDLSAVFRQLEQPGSWIALYNVESDPEYAAFLNEALGTVRHLIDRQQPGLYDAQGFIFISAPPSVTPFHIDRENNFWLQMRGRKIMNVWEASDRVAVKADAVEKFILHKSLENVTYDATLPQRSVEIDCGPGDGVYFPSTAPHMTRAEPSWVRPGDGVCVSIGIVFYTSVTRRHANVHAFNEVLRRFGMTPQPPGESREVDAVKYPLGRAVVAARRLTRGYSPPPGF